MNKLITKCLLVLCLSPITGHAWQPFVDIGMTKFTTPKNGLWYQDEFEHSLDLKSPSFGFGVAFETPFKNTKFLLGYKHLGRSSSEALASASDVNYEEWRNDEAAIWPLSTWSGRGDVQGVFGQIQHDFKHFYVKGGAWAHKATWEVSIPNWRCAVDVSEACAADGPGALPSEETVSIEVEHNNKPRIGWAVGAGVAFGKFDIAYSLWEIKSGQQYNTLNGGVAQEVSLRFTF